MSSSSTTTTISSSLSLSSLRPLPALLYEEELLVPLRWDITYGGARFVDSFCWPLYGSSLSSDEFASRTCIDYNLPNGFYHRMTMQMNEQLESFRLLINQLHHLSLTTDNIPWLQCLCEVQEIVLSIRLNNIEFSNTILWDLRNADITPEIFARRTSADLGLPPQMEPAIAHKIRETLFRLILQWIDEPSSLQEKPTESENGVISATVQLINDGGALVSELWKRAKPEDSSITTKIPNPVLPRDVFTNASIHFQ